MGLAKAIANVALAYLASNFTRLTSSAIIGNGATGQLIKRCESDETP
jgi:hypothetical protein